MAVVKEHHPIERLDFFQDFEAVADWTWTLFETWSYQHQSTVGRQLVRAVDSIGANLVEGDGRYTDADSVHFFIIARASARESKLWHERAMKRNLVDQEEAKSKVELLANATRRLNVLINYRRSKRSNVIRESQAIYREIDPFVVRDEE